MVKGDILIEHLTARIEVELEKLDNMNIVDIRHPVNRGAMYGRAEAFHWVLDTIQKLKEDNDPDIVVTKKFMDEVIKNADELFDTAMHVRG